MDTEVLEIFGSEIQDKKSDNQRIKLCYKILSSESLNLNQKSVQLLCNYIKRKLAPLGAVVCTCIAKASCSYMSLTTDKDSYKVFQNSISAILKFYSNCEDDSQRQGIILALFEMMNKHSSSIQSKLITEIQKIASNEILSTNEEISMTSASLLSSCCTSQHHFTTILDKLLFTIQKILNLGYQIVVGETGSKKSNLITIFDEKQEGFLEEKDRYSTDFIERLFKTICFTISKLLTQSYSFILQIHLERIIDLVQFSLILDSQLMKFQEKSSQKFSPSQLKKVLPTFHSSALLIYNSLIVTFKSHVLPWISSLNEILIQKLKGCKSDDELFKSIMNSAIICLSNLGGTSSKYLCSEIIPVLVQNIYELNKMQNSVISTKKSQEKKELYNISIINQANISSHSLEKIFKITSLMFLDIIPTCTHLITILINILTKWNDHKDQPMMVIIPSLYKLLYSSLIFSSMVHTQSPFLGVSISLFRKGITSSIPNISIECFSALNVIEMIMHPRSAPLYIPHGETVENYSLKRKKDSQDEKDNEEKNEKKKKIEDSFEEPHQENEKEEENEEQQEMIEEKGDNVENEEDELSEIEDDLDKEKIKGTGGLFVTKKMYEKIMSSSKPSKRKKELDLEEEEENNQEEIQEEQEEENNPEEQEESNDENQKENDQENEEENDEKASEEFNESIIEKDNESEINQSNLDESLNQSKESENQDELSEIEDDLDEEKLKGTGGMYISKEKLKHLTKSKDEDLESIHSDDPDEEKDLSSLNLDF